MADEDFSSTPANYQSPEQARAARELAAALIGKQVHEDPITHWTQGLNRMVNALQGKGMLGGTNSVDLARQQLNEHAGRSIPAIPPSPFSGPPGPVYGGNRFSGEPSPAPPTGGQPASPVPEISMQGNGTKGTPYIPKSSDDYGQIEPGSYFVHPNIGPTIKGPTTPIPQFGSQGAAAVNPTVAQALAFSGEPANQPGPGNDAQAAITNALAGRQGPASPPIGGRAAAGNSEGLPPGAVHIPQGTAPYRIPISPQQYGYIMNSPGIPDAMKNAVQQLYLQQGQPVETDIGFGNKAVLPSGGTVGRVVPTLEKANIKGPEGMEGPAPYVPLPPGVTLPGQPSIQFLGKPGQGQGGQQQQAPNAPTGKDPALESAPSLKFAPDEPTGAIPTQRPGGPLTSTPPGQPPTMLAQGAFPPQVNDMLDEMQKRGLDYKYKTEQQKKAIDDFQKEYKTKTDAGGLAARSLPQIQLARQLIEDPDFVSGFLADPRQDFNRFLSTFFDKYPNKAASGEVFQKIISGGIVEDMKIMLQGLGQVRVAEINLLSQATASRYNTLPANRAVLEIQQKTHEQAVNVSKLANAYAQGIRWDKDGKPYRASAPSGLDYGWNDVLQEYYKNHPLFTAEQIKNYDKLFQADPAYNKSRVAQLNTDYDAAQRGLPSQAHETKPAQPAAPAQPSPADRLKNLFGIQGPQ